jgi:hypothetical protein
MRFQATFTLLTYLRLGKESTGHSIYRATAEDTLFQKLKINNQATRLQ